MDDGRPEKRVGDLKYVTSLTMEIFSRNRYWPMHPTALEAFKLSEVLVKARYSIPPWISLIERGIAILLWM